jgi:hypothetical protein
LVLRADTALNQVEAIVAVRASWHIVRRTILFPRSDSILAVAHVLHAGNTLIVVSKVTNTALQLTVAWASIADRTIPMTARACFQKAVVRPMAGMIIGRTAPITFEGSTSSGSLAITGPAGLRVRVEVEPRFPTYMIATLVERTASRALMIS